MILKIPYCFTSKSDANCVGRLHQNIVQLLDPNWTFCVKSIFFYYPDLPRTEHRSWLPAIVFTIKTLLKQEGCKTADQTDEEQSAESKLPPCSDFLTTQTAVLFKCDSVNVVVIPLNDWEPMGSFTALYKQSLNQPADAQLL